MAESPPTRVPKPELPGPEQDAEARRRQRAKNLAIGMLVAGLAVLFYLITIVRMGRL